MSKYCYGRISKSNLWYVRMSSWHKVFDNKGDLLPCARVIKLFDSSEKCRLYIDWLKNRDKNEQL